MANENESPKESGQILVLSRAEVITRIQDSFNQEDFTTCSQLAEVWVKMEPDNRTGHDYAAASAGRLGQYNVAWRHYLWLTEHFPDHKSYRDRLGLSLIEDSTKVMRESPRALIADELLEIADIYQRFFPHDQAGDNIRAIALRRQGKLDEAEAIHKHAISQSDTDPSMLARHYNGLAQTAIAREDHYTACYWQEKAIAADPTNELYYENLCVELDIIGNDKAYQFWLEQLKSIVGDSPQIRFMESSNRLRSGDWLLGWQLYEARWESHYASRDQAAKIVKYLTAPYWQGEEGVKLLVYGEQGHGDTLMGLRYLMGLEKFKLESLYFLNIHPALSHLLKASVTFSQEVPWRNLEDKTLDIQSLPPHDYHTSLLSLIRHFQEENGPLPPPSWTTEFPQDRVAYWQEAMTKSWPHRHPPIYRLGLALEGNRQKAHSHLRDMDAQSILALFPPALQIVILQKEISADLAEACRDKPHIWLAGPEFDNFADTAIVMQALDLTISVDTAVIHLAGVLGLPALLLLNYPAEWRWGLPPKLGEDGSHPNPEIASWYPSVTIIRKPPPDEPSQGTLTTIPSQLATRLSQIWMGLALTTGHQATNYANDKNMAAALGQFWRAWKLAQTAWDSYLRGREGLTEGSAMSPLLQTLQDLAVRAAELVCFTPTQLSDLEAATYPPLVTEQAYQILTELRPEQAHFWLHYFRFIRNQYADHPTINRDLGKILNDWRNHCPQDAMSYVQESLWLKHIGKNKAAIHTLESGLRIDPQHPELRHNLAVLRYEAGEVGQATELMRALYADYPDREHSGFALGIFYLMQGEFYQGWPLYEFRPTRTETDIYQTARWVNSLTERQWQGQDLTDKTLLIIGEQGYGDSILFARYLPMVLAKKARLKLLVMRTIFQIYEDTGWFESMVERGEDVGYFDYQIMLGSLPTLFQNPDNQIPPPVKLPCPAEKLAIWQSELAVADQTIVQAGLKRIGLVFRGNPDHGKDFSRSLGIGEFCALVSKLRQELTLNQPSLPVLFYCLQPQLTDLERQFITDSMNWLILITPQDFKDSIAILDQMDILISVDTAMLNLAGNQGVPSIGLVYHPADFRWGVSSMKSSFYSSIYLVRSQVTSHWQHYFAELLFFVQSLLAEDKRAGKD